jgi:PAS domain-containing protein
VATIPGMLYTLTPEGELEFINDRITEFFGKSLDEMKEFFGKTVEEIKDWEGIMHQDDKQRALDTWMHALKAGEPYDREIRLRPAAIDGCEPMSSP